MNQDSGKLEVVTDTAVNWNFSLTGFISSDHTDLIREFKELTLYLMMAKSRFCKVVNSEKHPQNILAGYDYNPAL